MLPKERSDDQEEIARYQKEIAHLQEALEDRTQDIYQLIQWIQSLQQDVTAVYHSITWRAGNLITQLALKILRRSTGPTAYDHINRTLTTFEAWKINFLHIRRSSGLQTYRPWHETREYALWIKQYDTITEIMQEVMVAKMEHWSVTPRISIFLLVETGPLQETLASIQAQIYPHWELFLIGQDILLVSDKTIKYVVATSLNAALEKAQGEFFTLVKSGDLLAPHALYKVAEALNLHPHRDIFYSDEDRLNAQGQRCDPYFKSDWNPDLFYAQHFLRHLLVFRRTLVDQIGKFNSVDYPGEEEYDLILRMLEKHSSLAIEHIPHILYHRQERPEEPTTTPLRLRALEAHFQRLQQTVQLEETAEGHTRVIYSLPSLPPLVSLIIPTRDKLALLRQTVLGILYHTDYPSLEVIIMDNGSEELATLQYLEQLQKDSRVKVIRHDAPFNYSQLNNLGVTHASGALIALLNNDLEVISSGWLTEMVSHALRPQVGAVGAKLYYANDTLQHAGVIIGLGGMAGHGFKYLAKEAPGYHWKPFLVQNYSAVTGACLVMRRQVFEQIGGLEEKHLKVAFNDVDLCLRLLERGYRIVWTPHAELYHLESASRGLDNNVKKYLRLRHELNYMKSKWAKVLSNDPFYNPNLTIEYEDFSLAYPPRRFLL